MSTPPSPSPPSLRQNIYLFFRYLSEPPTTSSGWLLALLFWTFLSFIHLVATVVELSSITPGCSISGYWRVGISGVTSTLFGASVWMTWLGRRIWARREREARELRQREEGDEKEVLLSLGGKGEKSSVEKVES